MFGDKKTLSRITIDQYKKYYFNKSNISKITIYEFRHSHVSLIINEAVKRNLDMFGVLIMLSERIEHTIEVMQQIYIIYFLKTKNKAKKNKNPYFIRIKYQMVPKIGLEPTTCCLRNSCSTN